MKAAGSTFPRKKGFHITKQKDEQMAQQAYHIMKGGEFIVAPEDEPGAVAKGDFEFVNNVLLALLRRHLGVGDTDGDEARVGGAAARGAAGGVARPQRSRLHGFVHLFNEGDLLGGFCLGRLQQVGAGRLCFRVHIENEGKELQV